MKLGYAVHAAARVALIFGFIIPSLSAQTAYRYRDSNGQWVFTDRAASTAAPTAQFNLDKENAALRLTVERKDDGGSTQLIAVNECLCVATFQLKMQQSVSDDIPEGSEYTAVLESGTRRTLVQFGHAPGEKADLRYSWRAALGSPEAEHSPKRPYRAPFAIGTTYQISQAFPSRFTHVTPDSEYAVDFAVPDGTPIYSAREGTVINVRHDSFRGAIDAAMLDQANVVEILHEDGTIAVYAHLHWDSIRVHIGEHVVRGQNIADSGNTGFSSGPHLHFAIVRNSGLQDVSVPVQFAGAGGTSITPTTNASLTAY